MKIYQLIIIHQYLSNGYLLSYLKYESLKSLAWHHLPDRFLYLLLNILITKDKFEKRAGYYDII